MIMNRIQRRSPFWSLAGPFLGYLAIQWTVQFAIQFIVELPYVMRGYAKMFRENQTPSMEEILNTCLTAMEPAIELLLQYQVEITGVAALATMILTGILFLSDRKLEKRYGVVLREKLPLSKYWTILVFGAAGCVAATSLMTMAQIALYDAQYQETAEVLYSAGIPMQILVLGIVVPLAEELMFRGILFKRYRERQRFWYAAVWSSVFFALMHTNTTQSIYAFLLGLMLAYVYEKFGSFKAPLLLHMVMNLFSVLLTELGVFQWLILNPMRMAAAAIAGAFLCSAAVVMMQRLGGPVQEPIRTDQRGPMDL